MANSEQMTEWVRTIERTSRLLHRYHMRRVFADTAWENAVALTPPQVRMVMAVHEQGPVTIKQLTRILHVKAPAASMMVDRLVDMGVLTREDNPADRREVLVRISHRDQSMIEEVERRHFQVTSELCEALGVETTGIWADVCRRVQELLLNREDEE